MKTLPLCATLTALLTASVAPRLWAQTSLPTQSTLTPPIQPHSIVAQDGTGQFKTIQEAVDAAPHKSSQPVLILIKPGFYAEHLTIPLEKTNLILRGEDAPTTIISSDRHVKSLGPDGKEVGTIGSASAVISAEGFQAHNLTFQNIAPHVAQALAIYVQGDRALFRDCRFLGWQDTIRVRRGRSYFHNCFINGRTDFIYGEATAFFDRCHIHALEKGWITAANTPQDQPYGLVFSNCRITAEPEIVTLLGRPWRPYAHTVWLNTTIDNAIAPEGWHNWNKPEAEKTVRYAEYNSQTPTGEKLGLSKRVPWSKILTPEEAATYTIEKVLGGWNPS